MSNSNEVQPAVETGHATRKSRHGFWAGLVAGGLAGALIVGVVAIPLSGVSAAGPWAPMQHRGFHGEFDPEMARRHAEMVAEFLLWKVDATDDQRAEVKAILNAAINDLEPLARQHRANRERGLELFAKPTVDRIALDDLRKDGMKLADQASQRVVTAIADMADVLTAEQRAELVEMARQFHQ
ncbi:MAG: Spy/CpxP family protein refolding chaperone [Acidobacteriota bacterium]